jgi:hypothetical protein
MAASSAMLFRIATQGISIMSLVLCSSIGRQIEKNQRREIIHLAPSLEYTLVLYTRAAKKNLSFHSSVYADVRPLLVARLEYLPASTTRIKERPRYPFWNATDMRNEQNAMRRLEMRPLRPVET